MFAFLLPALLSAATIPKEQEGHGHGCHRHHHHHHHGHHSHHHYPSNAVLNTGTKHAISCDTPYQTYKAQVDAGSYAFTFTKPYTWAFQSFLYEAKTFTQVIIWDCFCSGDSFVVFDNGQKIFETEGGDGDCECNEFSQFPNQCLFASGVEESVFSFGIGDVAPGKHNITIGIKSSPYSSGTGFISFASACSYDEEIYPKKSAKLISKNNDIEFFPCCFPLSDCNWGTILVPELVHPEPEKPEGCHRHPRAAIEEQQPAKKK